MQKCIYMFIKFCVKARFVRGKKKRCSINFHPAGIRDVLKPIAQVVCCFMTLRHLILVCLMNVSRRSAVCSQTLQVRDWTLSLSGKLSSGRQWQMKAMRCVSLPISSPRAKWPQRQCNKSEGSPSAKSRVLDRSGMSNLPLVHHSQ